MWKNWLRRSVVLIGLMGLCSMGAQAVPIVQLEVWGSSESEIYRQIEADFNAKHKDVQFQIEMPGDYWTYINTKLAANDLPDLFFLTNYVFVWDYAKNGYLMDLSSEPFAGKIYAFLKPSLSYSGKLYAYPSSISYMGIIYNQDLFKQAGITAVPKTNSQLQAAVDKLKKIGVTPFAVAHKDGWVMNQAISSMQSTLLGKKLQGWLDQLNAGKGTWGVPGFDGVMKTLDIIINNAGPKPMDSDYNNMITLVGTKKAAMFPNGTWAIHDVQKIDPSMNLGVFAYPVSENPADAKLAVDVETAIVANSKSKNPDKVKEVLKYMADTQDKTGWLHYWTQAIGDKVALDYSETPKMSNTAIDFQKYVDSGNIVPWLYDMYPKGFNQDIEGSLSSYFIGKINKAQFIQAIDKGWYDTAALQYGKQ